MPHHRKRVPVPYTLTRPASLSLTTGAVSPLGWPVDFFDDFNGTFTRTSPPSWFVPAGEVGTNGFTTGALWNGSLAQYGCFFNGTKWGGYATGVMDMNNITMSGSNLIFTATNGSGTLHWASCLISFPSPWGLWEASMAGNPGANAATSNINMGFWSEANTGAWPVSGEMDIQETALINGITTVVHMGTTAGSDARKTIIQTNHAFPSGNWHDGIQHVYSGLFTPAYVASYVDGALMGSSNSSNILSNISTATDPPTASAAGSIGFAQASSHGSPTSLSYGDGNFFCVIFGIGQLTFTAAELPVTCSMDWFRHSKLTPASGGVHV